jgi:hypothetical protein
MDWVQDVNTPYYCKKKETKIIALKEVKNVQIQSYI